MNDIRVGTIVDAQHFPEARKPAYKLRIDFGPEIGIKSSSAQITARYGVEELVGTQVLAAIDLGDKRIAGFISEVLTLGVSDASGDIVLVTPRSGVENGAHLF